MVWLGVDNRVLMCGETENASEQARDAQESWHDGATQGSPGEIENAFTKQRRLKHGLWTG